MFHPSELAANPAATLDIKEDIRDECAKHGEVTNVTLFDLEPEGVASVRFKGQGSAERCVGVMRGRMFDGRVVDAYVVEGRGKGGEGWRRSDLKGDVSGEGEEGEEGGG